MHVMMSKGERSLMKDTAVSHAFLGWGVGVTGGLESPGLGKTCWKVENQEFAQKHHMKCSHKKHCVKTAGHQWHRVPITLRVPKGMVKYWLWHKKGGGTRMSVYLSMTQ